ncbi:MAG: hypothetical protein JWN34_1535 [Bryobacterales bacterium]|nr:hypothetical protein [Bryobacterales bacterium]
MKFILLVAQLADSLTFQWFTFSAYIQLWHDRFIEASALLIAAVIWQRFEKIAMLKALTPDSKGQS